MVPASRSLIRKCRVCIVGAIGQALSCWLSPASLGESGCIKKKHCFFIFGGAGSWLVAACGLSLVVVSGGYSSLRCQVSHCSGFSCRARALEPGSAVAASRLSCSGIFPDQGLKPCPLQAGYLSLNHQGSPWLQFQVAREDRAVAKRSHLGAGTWEGIVYYRHSKEPTAGGQVGRFSLKAGLT